MFAQRDRVMNSDDRHYHGRAVHSHAGGQVPHGHPRAGADWAAIASLATVAVLAVVIFLPFSPLGSNTLVIAAILPPLGIVFGLISRGRARRRGLQPSRIATAGLITGYVLTGLIVALAEMTVFFAFLDGCFSPGGCQPG